MKRRIVAWRSLHAAALLLLTLVRGAGAAPAASDAVWRGVETTRIAGTKYSTATYRLDKTALEAVLARAPKEGQAPLAQSPAVITLPMPDGSLSRFRIEDSPVFEPALAAQHPEIRSFRGQGIDDGTATLRFDWTPQGFHALLLASGLSVTVHPQTSKGDADYVSTQVTDAKTAFACGVVDEGLLGGTLDEHAHVATGDQLRTYRIAISTTGEFTTDLGGGTVSTPSTSASWRCTST